MSYNYAKLLGRIIEKCGSQSNFAEKIGLSERSVSLKMNNKRDWKQSEIIRACDVLDIQFQNISQYFFAAKV